jgi:hypothetical protein
LQFSFSITGLVVGVGFSLNFEAFTARILAAFCLAALTPNIAFAAGSSILKIKENALPEFVAAKTARVPVPGLKGKSPVLCMAKGEKYVPVAYKGKLTISKGRKKEKFRQYVNLKVALKGAAKNAVSSACAKVRRPHFLIPVSFFIDENPEQPLQVTLVVDGVQGPIAYQIFASPSIGSAAVTAEKLSYSPDRFRTGVDRLSVKAVDSAFGGSAILPIQITIREREFPASSSVLDPYRENLSYKEARAIACKYAFCDPGAIEVGMSKGLTAMVDGLVDYENSPDFSSARIGQAQKLGLSSYSQLQDFIADSVDRDSDRRVVDAEGRGNWWPGNGAKYWLAQLALGSPARGQIALHLYHWFPINLYANQEGGRFGGSGSQLSYRHYIDMLLVHALGKSDLLPTDKPIDGSFRQFTEDLIMNDQQSKIYLNHFQPCIHAVGCFPGAQNTNFGREVNQLLLLGQNDIVSGDLNYSEAHVIASARTLAGFIEVWSAWTGLGTTLSDNWRARGFSYRATRSVQSAIPVFGSEDQANYPWSLTDNDANKELFEQSTDSGVHKVGNLRPADYIAAAFNHPGIKWIAFRFFGRAVYPLYDPAQIGPIVNELVPMLKGNNWSIKELFRKLMKSEAGMSLRGRFGGISSPTEYIIRLLRIMDFPIGNYPALSGKPRAFAADETIAFVNSLLVGMDHTPMGTPSIFSWGERGSAQYLENQYGQVWTWFQRFLQRYNAPYRLMYYYTTPRSVGEAREGFDVSRLYPSGIVSPTPQQIMENFEKLLGTNFNYAQRAKILEYLDPPAGAQPAQPYNSNMSDPNDASSPGVGELARLPWASVPEAQQKFRVAWLFGVMAQFSDLHHL